MIDMAAHIHAVVDQAPPLPIERITRLRVILWGPTPAAPGLSGQPAAAAGRKAA
ncbi:hypothetical protein GCM10017673_14510 [Streptosporangium violaceochromogenes]|nr:hypothetical protein GCM10017673_14510 [Streptosporangium violaceochromogenes]